ncbi:DUF3810 domain-containing protein [Schaedlerella arabinosiphila]|uniref:DUF3810 domain-containing protein n=1 Tax=Schaedlerella arabinosiphila TaxID=2044587 RepID=UPI002557ED34|nr:DUF3810 domain-containing protein [Schaedlerella arabinosiphila]
MKEKKKRGTAEKRLLAACVFLAGAGILMVCARQVPGFAEWYAVHIYQKLTAVTGRVTGLAPFSVVEIGLYVLLILLPVTGVGAVVKSVRFGQGGENALCWASGLFLTASALLFLYAANCGVNYQRESFSEKTGLAAKQYTAEELKQVCLWLTEEVNALAGQVERDGSGEMILAAPAEEKQDAAAAEYEEMTLQVLGDTAVQAMTDLAEEYPDMKGYYPHPKPVCVSEILSYQNLSGVYSPFTIEANYNADMVDYNIPFTLCHELSHLRGFMQEEEANFIAFLACIGSDNRDFEYSGYLTGWVYCMNALRRADGEEWQQVREWLDEAAEADLRENSRFWEYYDGAVAEVSDKVNDTYLKANGQSEGVQSYGRMVDLIIAYAERKDGEKQD